MHRSFTRDDFRRQAERLRTTFSHFDREVRPGLVTMLFFVNREERVPLEHFGSEDWQMLCAYIFFSVLGFTTAEAHRASFVVSEAERSASVPAIEAMLAKEYSPLFAAMDFLCECAFTLQMHNTSRSAQLVQ